MSDLINNGELSWMMVQGFDLGKFLQKGLIYGGARPAKFDIQATLPVALQGIVDPTSIERLQFTCKAASVPAFAVGTTEAPYFGRKIKLSGDRVWDDWRITVMNDEDFNGRALFEAWNNAINSLIGNAMTTEVEASTVGGVANLNEEGYKSDWTITQYGKDTQIIRAYTLIGAWPRVVAEMPLDWDMTNRIQEFGVTVAFDMMIPALEGAHGNQTLYSSLV